MYGIKSLPVGSHKNKGKYAYEDLNLSTYEKEVFSTLVRALSKDYDKSQKEIKSEVASVKKKILVIIEDCFPDTSVTNCVKKILDQYSSFFKKELKENRIISLEEFGYWVEMDASLEEVESLDEAASNLDATIQKYAEDYSKKVVRGKTVPVSTLKRILKKVHSRGMQAFRNAPQSVRPWIRQMGDPAGAIVWGTSRIKAFLRKSKGTWYKFDSDLAEDVTKAAK